jgi:hypothetical protein
MTWTGEDPASGVMSFTEDGSYNSITGTSGQFLRWGSAGPEFAEMSGVAGPSGAIGFGIFAAGSINGSNGVVSDPINLSSVRNSAGNYTITFDTSADTANYSVSSQVFSKTTDTNIFVSNRTTSGFDVVTGQGDNGGTADVPTDTDFSLIVVAPGVGSAIPGPQGPAGPSVQVSQFGVSVFEAVEEINFTGSVDVTPTSSGVDVNILGGQNSTIGGLIVVAKYGGDYTSIASGVAAAAASGTNVSVRIEPGIYFEPPMTIADNTTVYGDSTCTIISTSSASPLFTVGSSCEIKNITMVGAGVAIHATGVASKVESCILSACATGIHLDSASRTIARDILAVSKSDGVFFDIDGGTDNIVENCTAREYGVACRYRNGANAIIDNFGVAAVATGVVVTEASQAGINSFFINNNDAETDVHQASGCLIFAKNCGFNFDKIFLGSPELYFSESANLKTGDIGLALTAELTVGIPEQGRESSFGEGDSYTRGIIILTSGVGTGTYEDVSDSGVNPLVGSFGFPNVSEGSAIYLATTVGNSDPVLWHGFKSLNPTLISHQGNSRIAIELSTSSGWVETRFSTIQAVSPYYPFASDVFGGATNQHVRFCADTVRNAWEAVDLLNDGTPKYWCRLVIKDDDLSSSPAISQIKLHPSRTELNEDGFLEYYGQARPVGVLPWHLGLLEPAGNSPANQDVYLGDNLGVGFAENEFTNGALDTIGYCSFAPYDIDTSCPIKIRLAYASNSNSGGNVRWVIRWAIHREDESIYETTGQAPSVALREHSEIYVFAAPTSRRTCKIEQVELDFSELIPRRENGDGDIIFISIERDGGDALDTHDGNIFVYALSAEYVKWSQGGHV